MTQRKKLGTASLEIVAVIYFLLFLLFMPLLNLLSIGIRYSIALSLAHEASDLAALASTYSDESANSAVNTTKSFLQNSVGAWNGIKLLSVKTRILEKNLKTGEVISYQSKLPKPADQRSNLYLLETELDCSLDPILSYTQFPIRIQGLTEAIPVKIQAENIPENPQGLHL